MAGYLLDTNAISEIRKGKKAAASVRAWLETVRGSELHLSVLTLGEVRKGVELLRGRDPGQASAIEQWLGKLETTFADRVLQVTPPIADRWGRIAALRPLSAIDGLLAATALTHDLTFVTRNTADVGHTGVSLLNPFAALKS